MMSEKYERGITILCTNSAVTTGIKEALEVIENANVTIKDIDDDVCVPYSPFSREPYACIKKLVGLDSCSAKLFIEDSIEEFNKINRLNVFNETKIQPYGWYRKFEKKKF